MYIKKATSYEQSTGQKLYKESGIHTNKNALNDMWQNTEG